MKLNMCCGTEEEDISCNNKSTVKYTHMPGIFIWWSEVGKLKYQETLKTLDVNN